MKFLKPVLACLIIIISNYLIVKAQNSNQKLSECSEIPGLSIIEVTDQQVVHFLWSFDGTPSFYNLEYKALNACVALLYSEGQLDVNQPDFPEPVIETTSGCPPDVWTEVPVPTFKTSTYNSTSYQNRNGFGTGVFLPCVQFEFRMKVVCNNETLFSDIVPYFYDNGNCLECLPERILTQKHNVDMVIQAENRISSNAKVEANITYKAGERVVLKSGFSSKPGFNFKVMNEFCLEP